MAVELTDFDKTKIQLLGDLMIFQRVFFKLRKGQDFALSTPPGRECRHITMCKAFKRVFLGECKRLIISIPPRYSKTEWAVGFIAWATANFPDSNHLYISYAQSVASRQTQAIRDIITHPMYRHYFGVELDSSSSAKDNFRTTKGGEIFAAGSGGPITSRGAGLQGVNRYGGCILIDDIHKPEEVYSDTMRQSTNDWYFNTLYSRLNDPISTPIIVIGQRLHEDDLLANLEKQTKADGSPEWECITIPALDEAGNELDPTKHTKEMLLQMKEREPYVFSAQYQQNPLPAGGGIFKKDDFLLLNEEPEIISTFITSDTAASTKDYADFTVFSFFGIYRIKVRGIDTGLYGLHWIDCHELRCEPKDLENEFFAFYHSCMMFHVKPSVAVIESASTGQTLCSVLKGTPGLRIIDVKRTKEGGSKTQRFLECQPYVASHRVTLSEGAKHAKHTIDHMSKITASGVHRHDDIADSLQLGIQAVFLDEILMPKESTNKNLILDSLTSRVNYLSNLRQQA